MDNEFFKDFFHSFIQPRTETPRENEIDRSSALQRGSNLNWDKSVGLGDFFFLYHMYILKCKMNILKNLFKLPPPLTHSP